MTLQYASLNQWNMPYPIESVSCLQASANFHITPTITCIWMKCAFLNVKKIKHKKMLIQISLIWCNLLNIVCHTKKYNKIYFLKVCFCHDFRNFHFHEIRKKMLLQPLHNQVVRECSGVCLEKCVIFFENISSFSLVYFVWK